MADGNYDALISGSELNERWRSMLTRYIKNCSMYTLYGLTVLVLILHRYFIGTSVSTFTFRIHEEREILGFAQEMTYNRLCGDEQDAQCEQPAKWECKYE